MLNFLKTVFSLIKYKVSMAVTFTAITGYLVFTGSFDIQVLYLAISIFILAGGSSALNECQESKFDVQMSRTKNRPIPSGKISLVNAWIVAAVFSVVGSFLLYVIFNQMTALLGLINLIWYNIVYTNLKRITAYAVVPGSLVGAIPVFMGWTAGGGYVFDSAIVFIAFFLFIWQIPHFWLLMLKYGKDYERAGFPTINQTLHPQNLKILIFAWVLATSFSSIIVPLFLVNLSLSFFILIFVLNILFIAIFTKLSFGKVAELSFKKTFISINVYMFIFMIMLIVYHLNTA